MIEGYLETRELAAEALHRMAVCFANLGGVEQMKDVFDQVGARLLFRSTQSFVA